MEARKKFIMCNDGNTIVEFEQFESGQIVYWMYEHPLAEEVLEDYYACDGISEDQMNKMIDDILKKFNGKVVVTEWDNHPDY